MRGNQITSVCFHRHLCKRRLRSLLQVVIDELSKERKNALPYAQGTRRKHTTTMHRRRGNDCAIGRGIGT